MLILRRSLALFLILLSTSGYAFKCPRNGHDKSLAKEIVKLEMSGLRIHSMKNSNCLEQKNFNLVRTDFDPSNEEITKPDHIISRSTVKINSVDLIDDSLEIYRIKYSYRSNRKLIEDEIEYRFYSSPKNQFMYGCAATLAMPEFNAVDKGCYRVE